MNIKAITTALSALTLLGSPGAIGAEPDTPAAKIEAAKERYEEMARTGKRDVETTKSIVADLTKVVVANPTDTAVPDAINSMVQMTAHWFTEENLIGPEVFQVLEKHYLDDEEIDPTINSMTLGVKRSKGVENFLLNVAGKSERPIARAAHLFTKAKLIEGDADQEDEYRKLLTEVVENYPEVTLYRTKIATHSQNLMNQLDRKVGMKAPEIVGKDVDGNELKLSDYRGKVVVLSFWGDW